MQKHTTTQAPVWQSRALLTGALLAAGAAGVGSAVYAFQSASLAQVFYGVPTDAVLRTMTAVAADLSVVFGPVVTVHLWRTGRRGLRRQSYLAAAVALIGLLISVGNFSGYLAWTRGQRVAEAAQGSVLYAAAVDHIRSGGYVSPEDRNAVTAALAPAGAERQLGDVAKALLVLAGSAGMASAYRLPLAPKRRRSSKRPADIRGKLKVA